MNIARIIYIGTALSIALCTTTATAESWYVGGGLGVSDINGLCKGAPTQSCDDQGAAVRLFGGWKPNRAFALEAALDVGSGFITPGARAAGFDGDTSSAFFSINALGFIPLGQRVSLYGGLTGAFSYASTEVSDYRYRSSRGSNCYYDYDWVFDDWYYYCSSGRYEDDRTYESDVSTSFGALAGVEVKIARRFAVRAQVQRYFHVDGGLAFEKQRDVDFVTVNGLFTFGGRD